MGAPARIRVLLLEDSAIDAELMVRELRKAGLDVQADRVETEADFAARLTPDLDLILSDNALPLFGSQEALQLVRARGLDVPFIVVSGAFREEIAAQAARIGADGCMSKDNMAELVEGVMKVLEKRRPGHTKG